ncbi:MAG: hypothetical protein KAS12_00940, partial [Candidatus Aenigmarchaeota archaeon]|nr:hypothetical protein [Candidatus Aenigmarchaeota archaeon]
LSAVVTNTGMNEITVTNVAAFKTDGRNCILKNTTTILDVGDMFSISGCGMGCDEFTSLKAYTDCAGVLDEFAGTLEGC